MGTYGVQSGDENGCVRPTFFLFWVSSLRFWTFCFCSHSDREVVFSEEGELSEADFLTGVVARGTEWNAIYGFIISIRSTLFSCEDGVLRMYI